LRSYAVAPQIDDLIEILPEIKDDSRDQSAWYEAVVRRYFGVSATESAIEVHVQLPGGRLSKQEEKDLRAEGFS
jgi:hypothetical protein